MSDYSGPMVDPTNPHATLRATFELMRDRDFSTTERLLGWALDFNPEHAGLQRRMSELRWEERKVDESLQWAEQAIAADPGDAESYAQLGLLHMRRGLYADAAELLFRAVEIRPDVSGYLIRLAQILMHLGRGIEAVDLAERATVLRPQEVNTHLFLIGLHQRYGNFDAAETMAQKAIEQVPRSGIVLRRMAELRFARGDLRGARLWVEHAKEVAPEDPAGSDFEATLALAVGDLVAAEGALLNAVGLPHATSHHKRRLSDVLMRCGDRVGAFAWAQRAISDHPQDLAGLIHLANLHNFNGQSTEAFTVLDAGIAKATTPNDATALMRHLSSLLQQQGNPREALNWATRATAADPFDAENHAHLASIFLQQNDPSAAREPAMLAAKFAPAIGAHSRRISDIAWREGKTETAFNWANRAVESHPSDVHSHAYQAGLLISRGRYDEAEAPLSRAVNLAPLDAGLLTRLSDLKARLGKQGDAFDLAERAIAARPRELIGYNQLATLHHRLGELTQAFVVLQQAAELEPVSTALLRRLADIEQRRGNNAAAMLWLRKAIDADPQDPNTYNQLASLEFVRGEQTAAEEALMSAADFAGSNSFFHRRLSEVLSRRGDEQGALCWAKRTVSDFPNDPAGLLQLGGLHLIAGRLDEAEAACKQAFKLAATPAQALGPLHRLSDIAIKRNNNREALAWLAKGIEVAPREAAAYNHLAGLHLSYGNLIAAKLVAEKAVEIAPADVGALRRLSDITLRQGETNMALNLARRAITANFLDPHSHAHEASILLAAGDIAGAQASVERALKLAPTDVGFLRRNDYLIALLHHTSAESS